MRDYRAIISNMKKHAIVHGEPPYIKMSEDLNDAILYEGHFDGSVVGVSASILSGGRGQVERMAAAFGPTYLPKFFFFLKSLIDSGKNYGGLKELYDITAAAYELTRAGSDERLETKPTTPQNYEEFRNLPMHEDVKDKKGSYRALIERRASK